MHIIHFIHIYTVKALLIPRKFAEIVPFLLYKQAIVLCSKDTNFVKDTSSQFKNILACIY